MFSLDDDEDLDLSLSLDSFEILQENYVTKEELQNNDQSNYNSLHDKDITLKKQKHNFVNTIFDNSAESSIHHKKLLTEMSPKLVYERKFPGPAGLFPKRQCVSSTDHIVDDVISTHFEIQNNICSQKSDFLLDNAPWQFVFTEIDSKCKEVRDMLDRFTISYIKSMIIISRNSPCKIPFFAAVIHYIDFSVIDPTIAFKDSHGEIHGTLHRDIWEKFGAQLSVGSILFLRNVGILQLYNSQHLNITLGNIISIYTASSDNMQNTTVIEVNNFPTAEEVYLLQKRWESYLSSLESQANKNHNSLPCSPNNSLFTIHSPKSLQMISKNTKSSPNMTPAKNLKNITQNNVSPLCIQTTPFSAPKFCSNSVPKKAQFNDSMQTSSKVNELCDENNQSICQNSNQNNFSVLGSVDSNDMSIVCSVLEGINANSIFDDF